jgi:GAF domain-containing protein
MRCPRCQHDNRPTARFCEDCANPFNGAIPTTGSYAHLKVEVETLRRALSESLEQQIATSEILRVISSSPTDVQPVLDTISEHAARLCGSYDAAVYLVHGDRLRLVAHHGPVPVHAGGNEMPLSREFVAGRTVIDRRPIQVDDLSTSNEFPGGRRLALEVGYRTVLTVPLLREGVGIGMVGIRRREVQPFTDKQTALLETFAAQAVIAIENVRLFTEREARNADLKIALDQQIATGEILRVISTSPTNEQPVFDAIVQHARRLCEASYSVVFLVEDNQLVMAAADGIEAAGIDAMHGAYPRPVARDTTSGRAILDRSIIHLEDSWTDPAYTHPLRDIIGLRSILTVPIFRDGLPIGAVSTWRPEARPFTDKQIALLQTFADQAVIALENVRLFKELQEKNQALADAHARVTEALDQQTATSEILGVISRSPTDVQPVFDTIVRRAVQLCNGLFSALYRFDGELLHPVAQHNFTPEALEELYRVYPARPTRALLSGRAILDRAVVHVPDAEVDPEHQHQALSRAIGYRSGLFVPMLREGTPIGVIGVTRAEPGPFSNSEIELLKTFADQAVIAIENVRLFTELQQKNNALTQANAQVSEALEQQTATSEILRVMSGSPTDIQPVFDTIIERSVRLCDARLGALLRFDGQMIHLAAHAQQDAESLQALQTMYPMPANTAGVSGRALLSGTSVHVRDMRDDPELAQTPTAQVGHRTVLSVPMMREGAPIGVITVARARVEPFSDRQVELLQTFADQAVIAIENVRLFTEVQEKNRDLSEALEQQTATSDILRAISSSPTDVQPVFQAVIENAVRLCGGVFGRVFRREGQTISLAANQNFPDDARDFPRPLHDDETLGGRVARTGRVIRSADVETDPSIPATGLAAFRGRRVRSVLVVPIAQQGETLGSIVVGHADVAAFSDAHVAMLQTFADQAVIAIENVRLFKELRARTTELTRSVDELTALGEVSRALSSTLDLETVLQTIVSRAVQIAGTAGCTIWEFDEPHAEFRLRASHYADQDDAAALQALGRVTTIPKGQGVTTRVMEQRQAVQIHDITTARDYESPIRQPLVAAGHRALLGVPLLSEDEVIGVLAVTRKTPGEFEPETVRLLSTFATQSGLAIENARLFREIEDKSRQLEVASQHKSEFLANMSHELRTPLNAIIGFSEVLTERMFGELNEKQDEYLKDIYASGQHLLSLINDILDLSKVEAGRMELELADFHLPSAVENALILVRERASRRGIALGHTLDSSLGMVRADERKVKQVLLNLLSNALKFTPEGGRVDVRAGLRDDFAEVSVADTGVGIAPEDQEAVFEEFRQVGAADKKVEGTGLGLALSRKFVELHGGRIWVTSKVGAGSTFTFTLPVRREKEMGP